LSLPPPSRERFFRACLFVTEFRSEACPPPSKRQPSLQRGERATLTANPPEYPVSLYRSSATTLSSLLYLLFPSLPSTTTQVSHRADHSPALTSLLRPSLSASFQAKRIGDRCHTSRLRQNLSRKITHPQPSAYNSIKPFATPATLRTPSRYLGTIRVHWPASFLSRFLDLHAVCRFVPHPATCIGTPPSSFSLQNQSLARCLAIDLRMVVAIGSFHTVRLIAALPSQTVPEPAGSAPRTAVET
jgi:hypothetical protein